MSALDRVVRGLKDVSGSVALPSLKPDPKRRDWSHPEVDSLARRLDAEVLAPFAEALDELSEDEHRKFKDIVAGVAGSIAAVLGASSHGEEARSLLQRAAELAASQATRIRLQVAREQLEWHVQLALAEWLGRAGDSKASRKVLEQVARGAPDGAIRAEARAALTNANDPLEPINGAPSLVTINGFGTRLVGRADERPDGTYVATLCLCALFIPVLPLASYRVADAGNGRTIFYGKMKVRRGWLLWRNVLLVSVVAAIAASFISEELNSPRRRARAAVAHALETVKLGTPAEASTELEHVFETYALEPSAHDELKPAAEAWARLELRPFEGAATLEQVDGLVRLANRVKSFGGTRSWAREGAAPLLARLRSAVTELGLSTPELTEASLELLTAATAIATPQDADALTAQIHAIHLERARGLKAAWPLWAFEHLVQALPDPDALTEADALLRGLGNAPEVLFENVADVNQWLPRTADAALARAVRESISAGQAMANDPEREKLLASTERAPLLQALRATPHDQGVAVSLALLHRDANEADAALQMLQALGPPGTLTFDAQSLLTMLLLDSANREKGRALLEDIVDRQLPRLGRARDGFETTLDSAERRLVAAARRNELPLSVQQELDKADESHAKEIFQAWLNGELGKDRQVQQAREAYGRVASVASMSVMLGSIELQEAAGATGETRARLLRRAEHHFVSVEAERQDSASYRLGYGQVLHRLGRAKEGDVLLQAVLDSGTGAEKLDAAFAYRELGLMQRSRAAYEKLWNGEPQPTRDSAAAALSAMADRLEDAELWLSRVASPTASTRASLGLMRARRFERDGKLSDAARELGPVVTYYERTAKNDAPSANNAAMALRQRYACTGDLASFDRAVEHLRSCRRLSPDNGLLVSHLANTLSDRAAVRLLEKLVHVQALRLDGRDAQHVMSMLLSGPLGPELRARLKAEPLVRELTEVSTSEQALGPGRADPFGRLWSWVDAQGDVAALTALADRATANHASFDFSEEVDARARTESGADDAIHEQAFLASRELLKPALLDAHGPTRAVALAQRCGLNDALARLKQSAALEREAIADCEAAVLAWPALRPDLSGYQLRLAILEALPGNSSLQDKWNSSTRRQDETLFAAEVLLDETLASAVAKQPSFALAVTALRESRDDTFGLGDWALAVASHDESLVKRVRGVLASERGRALQRLHLALSAPGPLASAREALYARATK